MIWLWLFCCTVCIPVTAGTNSPRLSEVRVRQEQEAVEEAAWWLNASPLTRYSVALLSEPCSPVVTLRKYCVNVDRVLVQQCVMVVFRESVWSSNRQCQGKPIFSVSRDNAYRFSGVALETWDSLEIEELLVKLTTYVHIP